MPDITIHPASFRDPSGFIFQWKGQYYRQVNTVNADDYNLLMRSGLYHNLQSSGQLLAHTETSDIVAQAESCYKTLLPQQLQFITYPYEWCFGQLKDAALLTLDILRKAIDHGMIIKDATPYNIQFVNGGPLFIDTLSFETYDATKAWVAYRQFCNMFLFPLYLEHYLKADIQKTLVVYPDGIPVEITSRLLPLKSRTNLGVWLHVYLQNTVTGHSRHGREEEKFNTRKLLNLVQHLEDTVQHLKGRGEGLGWKNYYSETITGNDYLARKEAVFRELLESIPATTVLDIGANDGYFSKVMAGMGKQVIAVDNDSRTISELYRAKQKNILPLVMDAANPSPATGFNNRERPAFHDRIRTDAVVALALIHHLVIGRNVPLTLLASWLAGLSKHLIIEFVPREDDKVQRMLASRKDIFKDYTPQNFERIFSSHFTIARKVQIPGTARVIYLMEKR